MSGSKNMRDSILLKCNTILQGEWSMKGLHQLHSCFLEACQSATFTDRDSADIRDQLTAVLQSVLNFCQEVEMNR